MPGEIERTRFQGAGAAIGDAGAAAVDATDDVSAVAVADEPAAASAPVIPPPMAIAQAPHLDPRLQKLVAVRRSGGTTAATASTVPGEVAVLARVSDAEAWSALSEVRPGTVLPLDGDGEGVIVTGRIPLARIEAVRRQPFVLSLKAAQNLKPALSASLPQTRADPTSLGSGLSTRGGAGAVVGIVDYGCDFVHQNFRTPNGTRIEAIWHQGGLNSATAPFGYGALYERAAIDAALRQPTPYSTLGYGPARDRAGSQGSHGTHVMDIAAGNGGGSNVPGYAPEAAIIFVDVSSEDIAWRGSDVVSTSFGDSVRLLEAVRYIFDRAGNRPCVVNVSLGTNGGPHDGSTLVERGLDRLVEAAPNRAVVIAASNSYGDQIHASGTLSQSQSLDIKWNRPPSTNWQDELEIWYSADDRIAVELLMPDGSSLGTVEPGENGEAQDNGDVVLLVANRLSDPNNGDNNIGIFIDDRLPSGVWTLRLTGRAITNGRFHAWIERDDNSQASFLDNVEDDFTIGSVSCGRNSLVVASYDAHKTNTPLSWFSSAGPTRDGRQKPELSAPGHGVSAAHSRTKTGVVIKSGTSMAAPAVAGALALLLAEAAARGVALDIGGIRALLLGGLRAAPGAQGWHTRWGGGTLDVAAAMAALPRQPPPPPPPPAAGLSAPKASGAPASRSKRAAATGRLKASSKRGTASGTKKK